MQDFLYFIFALVPAVLWIYYFRSHDKAEKEPVGFLVFSALLGALVVIPAALAEVFVAKNIIPFFFPKTPVAPLSLYGGFTGFLVLNIFAVAVIEEVFKFLAIRLTVYNSKHFNEVSDGIVYMVSAALGFAAFENFLYFSKFGPNVIFMRSLFTPLFHASASAIAGHYLGLVKWDKRYSKKVYLALAASVGLHFIYDLLVFFSSLKENFLYMILAIALLVVSGYWVVKKFKDSEDIDEKCEVC